MLEEKVAKAQGANQEGGARKEAPHEDEQRHDPQRPLQNTPQHSGQLTGPPRRGQSKLRENCSTDIRSVHELLGSKNIRTTMIYPHVLNKPGLGIRSAI